MRKEQKKIIKASAIILVIIVAFVFVLSQHSDSFGKICMESDTTGEIFCIEQPSFLSKFTQQFAIIFTDSTPQPGEYVETTLVLSVPANNGVSYVAFFLETEDGNQIDKFDITSSVAPLGVLAGDQTISFDSVVTFKAPNTQGTYAVRYIIRDNNNVVLTEERKVFEVGIPDGQCPNPSCNNWKTIYTIEGGVVQARDCSTYDNTCKEYKDTETKTICNNDYVISGTQTDVATGTKTCVAVEQGQTNTTQTNTTTDTPVDDSSDEPVDNINDPVEETPNEPVEDTKQNKRSIWDAVGILAILGVGLFLARMMIMGGKK